MHARPCVCAVCGSKTTHNNNARVHPTRETRVVTHLPSVAGTTRTVPTGGASLAPNVGTAVGRSASAAASRPRSSSGVAVLQGAGRGGCVWLRAARTPP